MRMVQLLLNGVMLLIQLFVKILTDLPQLLMDAVFCGLNAVSYTHLTLPTT